MQFAALLERLEEPPPPEPPPDEQTQPLVEVARVLHTAFHPERKPDELPALAEQLELLLDDPLGITPCHVEAVAEPSGASLYHALAAGLAAYPAHLHSSVGTSDACNTFFVRVLEMLLDRDVPVNMRLPERLPAAEATERTARTALMYASLAGSARAVESLLAANADVNLRDPRGGATKPPIERALGHPPLATAAAPPGERSPL